MATGPLLFGWTGTWFTRDLVPNRTVALVEYAQAAIKTRASKSHQIRVALRCAKKQFINVWNSKKGGILPSPTQPTIVSIAELAVRLHKSCTNSLTVPFLEGEACVAPHGFLGAVEVEIVRFESFAELNSIVAAHVLTELRANGSLTAEMLFDAAYQLLRCEIGHPDMAAGRLLASVAEADVLAMAVQRLSDGADIFDVLHLAQAFLIHANTISLDSLIALSDAQYEKTKRDMAAGMFFGAIERWLSSRCESAVRLTRQLLAEPSQTRENLLDAAWMGWFRSDATSAAQELLLIASQAQHLQTVPLVIRLAGRMLHEADSSADFKGKLEELIDIRLLESREFERHAAIQAATGLLHRTSRFDVNLKKLADASDQLALAHIAVALGPQHQALIEQGRYFFWLETCAVLSSKYGGAIGTLEYPLSLLLTPAGAYQKEVLDFLKSWVVNQPSKGPSSREFAETFNQCTLQILNHPELLSKWLPDWLCSGDVKLPSAAAGVLFGVATRGASGLKYSTELLDEMTSSELMFLARRMLGYVHDVDQLLSLTLSILETKDAEKRAFPFMKSLLVEEIGYDYPGSTIDALKDASLKTTRDSVRQLLDSACLSIETSMDQLEKLPRLKELSPPEFLRRQFVLSRGRQMSDASKEASKKSIFQQIATTTYIKAGQTTFRYQRDSYTEPMQMQTISHSYQLPRRENLDPVGNAIRGYQLRNAKRGEQ